MDAWRTVLAKARRAGWFAGLDPGERPRDMGQQASYDDALRALPARYPLPGPLTLPEVEDFLDRAGEYQDGWFVPL